MPYLQNMTPESMVIMWEMDAAESVIVEYGLTTGYGSSTPATSEASRYDGTYIFKVELAGLLPRQRAPLPAGQRRRLAADRRPVVHNGHGRGDRFCLRGLERQSRVEPWCMERGPVAADHFHDGPTWRKTTSILASRPAIWPRAAHRIPIRETTTWTEWPSTWVRRVPWFNAWGNHDTGVSSAILRRFADMPSKGPLGLHAGIRVLLFHLCKRPCSSRSTTTTKA